MATSQNGYSANDRSVIASYTVPGTVRKYALRKGNSSYLLLHFAAWFHKNIEKIDTGQFDDWGYAERNIRGSSKTLSNHASGTAIDINATQHPLGKTGTFTATEVAKIRQQLKVYEGAIRWGGDYTGRKDAMHFEINAGAAKVTAVADKLKKAAAAAAKPKPAPAPKPAAKPAAKPVAKPAPYKPGTWPVRKMGNRGEIVKHLQKLLGFAPGKQTGYFGAETKAAVVAFQKKNKLVADGIVGDKTWERLTRK